MIERAGTNARSTVTRGEQMLALRNRRMAASPPFLRGGFRPFFFGAAAWGVIAMSVWLGIIAGYVALPAIFEPVAWHRHELLFGFVGAAVAGFLLTAIPNWTGRLPIAGPPLFALFSMWAAARVGALFSAIVGIWPAAVLDVGFFAVLTALCAREVLATKNRNLPVVVITFMITLADAADYGAAAGTFPEGGWRAAIALIVLMISIIGGRIIPSFTRNWMAKQGQTTKLPAQPAILDRVVIVGTATCLLFWLLAADNPLVGYLLVLAATLQALRLSRWGSLKTLADPLVLVLHVGYCWVPVGLLLLGFASIGLPIARSGAVHALTVGAMSTMILAVMTRATLGHTGRALHATVGTTVLFVCVSFAALLRVLAALGVNGFTLALSGVLWLGSLALFLVIYGPMLWSPRAEQT